MDRSEPALIPEWLKSNGNHQYSSSLRADEHSVSKHGRNKSSFTNSEHNGGRSYSNEKTTSNYFRRSAGGKDSSYSRSYSSFNRNHRDREWEDPSNFRDKNRPISGDHRHREYSDHLVGVLPGRFSKEILRRTQSMVNRKSEGTLAKKVAGDFGDASNRKNHVNNSLLLTGGSVPSSNQTLFGRDFPSLGGDQRHSSFELGRVPSPVLPSAIQSVSVASLSGIGADGWTSSLAEVPGVIAMGGTGGLPSQQAVSGNTQRLGGLNMAEAVVQGPARARTPPQVSVDNQRLEELAIKQSRQLIPVISSTPKPMLLAPSDKLKPKSGQLQAQFSAVQLNQGLRSGTVRVDPGKTSSNLSKLQVLKPARELNGVSSAVVKENLSPKNGVKVVNTLSLNPAAAAAASVPLRVPANIQNLAGAERKCAAVSTNLEKRPSSLQAQSRSDFFNLLKKKSTPSAINTCANEALPCESDKSLHSPVGDSSVAVTGDANSVTSESKVDRSSEFPTENGRRFMMNGDGNEGMHLLNGKGEDQSDVVVPYPDEEEAAFLRSLGWEENTGEDGGLTEDEIKAFYELMKVKPIPPPEPMRLQQEVNNSNNGSYVNQID